MTDIQASGERQTWTHQGDGQGRILSITSDPSSGEVGKWLLSESAVCDYLNALEADRDRLQGLAHESLLRATGGELGCCELAAASGFWHYSTCPNYKPSEYEAVTLAEKRAEAAEADRDALRRERDDLASHYDNLGIEARDLRRRAEEAEALLWYWDEPCAPDDPMTKLDGLITFLDAWDEAMKTPPSVQAELRSWRNRYRAHLAALTAAATREA